ncbi:MAG: fibronectin type III domain-containing protein [Acidimicrobiales bacterium]
MAVVTISVIAALVPSSVQAASAQAAPADRSGNVSHRLEQLADTAGVATSAAAEDRAIGLPSDGAGSLLRRADGTFLANARLTAVDAATEARLARAGATITARSVADHLVTLAMDSGDIDNVAAVEGVEWLEEVLTPEIHRADRSELADALNEGGVDTSAACSSRVISEGDTHLGAAAARSTYGVDGTGVKIGILSDSYNNLGGAATDVANGELPGTGNPCGWTTPVVVQSELASGGSDEARGMAQAVHDLAPGAQILVASAFNGDVDFANQIRNLAAAGAKVIVDDISYFNEPVYQDGIIAKAVMDVTAAGVTYFSSAANSNIILGGKDVASYEATQYRPTTCPASISSNYGEADCHDFDPGTGADGGDLLTVNNGGKLVIKLGYNEPQYEIDTDLDLFLVDTSTNSVVANAYVNNKTSSKQAYELLSYTNSSGAAKTYRLVVGRYRSNSIPQLKLIFLSASGLTSVQWNTTSGGDTVGPTGYGHNMMRGAGSVAAIRYDSTTAPETFSSRGPATYCWNPVVGTTPASALPNCVNDTIDVAATDGAANSFFGSLSGSVYRFYGTSQAAPHAAAVAVLQVQARPCRTPAEILAAQRASGIAIGSYGVDAVGGGRLNASTAIANLTSCIALPTAPTNVTGTPGNGQVSLTWTAPSSPGGSPITGYQVTPYLYDVAQTAVTFNSTATAQTVTGLTNGTPYTFRVAAFSAAGTGTSSTASAEITPRTVPTAPRNVSGASGDGQVTLVWAIPVSDGGSPVTGYTVTPYIGATAQTPRVFNTPDTDRVITGLTNNTAYTFKVKATNAAGTGPDSEASPAIAPLGIATAPTGVTGTAGIGAVTLSWIAPVSDGGSPIIGYVVTPYIGASPQTPVTFNSTATTQTITGLGNGTTYTFTVQAETANGVGPESAPSTPITPRNVPGSPYSVTGTPGNGQVTLTWSAPVSNGGSPLTGYTVTPSIGSSAQTPIAFDSTATSQTITGLTNGTTYTFKVKATNAAGSGTDSASSPPLTPSGPPAAPTDVTGTAGDGQVTLSWVAPTSDGGSPLVGYTVTPYTGGVAQTSIDFASTATTQVVTGLTNGTPYTFKVRASNAAGSGDDSDASPAITPRTVPDAPTRVTAIAGDAQATVSWTEPPFDGGAAITGYTVIPYIGTLGQAPRVFNSSATLQTITGLANGTTYTFKVKATNVAGTGAESTASDPVTPHTLPSAPTNVAGTAGNAQVALTWTAPSSDGGSPITGYRVTPYIGATAQTPVEFASTATSQTITGLTNGTAYTFKVAATTAVGTGADSAASAAITPERCPARRPASPASPATRRSSCPGPHRPRTAARPSPATR